MAIAKDKRRVLVTVPLGLLKLVDAEAERQGLPRSQQILQIIERYYDNGRNDGRKESQSD